MDNPPPPPEAALTVFEDRLDLAIRYVALLADTGISHGLLGPRERPRLWDRHVFNCAVISPLFGPASEVADVGSGAGLPGLPLAIARPDLDVTLIEPLLRRTRWLEEVVAQLRLENVSVVRARAEEMPNEHRFDFVTARAVAPAAALARVALPLVKGGGALHALKGERANRELTSDQTAILRMGASRCEISRHGAGLVELETVVLSVFVEAPVDRRVDRRGAAADARRRPQGAMGAKSSRRRARRRPSSGA